MKRIIFWLVIFALVPACKFADDTDADLILDMGDDEGGRRDTRQDIVDEVSDQRDQGSDPRIDPDLRADSDTMSEDPNFDPVDEEVAEDVTEDPSNEENVEDLSEDPNFDPVDEEVAGEVTEDPSNEENVEDPATDPTEDSTEDLLPDTTEEEVVEDMVEEEVIECIPSGFDECDESQEGVDDDCNGLTDEVYTWDYPEGEIRWSEPCEDDMLRDDVETGLRWRVTTIRISWNDAIDWCQIHVGEEWRLPSMDELWTILPAGEEVFGYTATREFWSSIGGSNRSLVLDFSTGGEFQDDNNALHYVRCVTETP